MLKIALYIRSANSAVNKKSRLLQLVEYDKIRTFKFVLSSRPIFETRYQSGFHFCAYVPELLKYSLPESNWFKSCQGISVFLTNYC